MPILTASQLRLLYGEVEIFSKVDLQVDEGSHVGIVGPNGGGKSSLIKLLVGQLPPDAGSVTWQNGINVGYVAQSPEQDAEGTLRDEVMSVFDRLRSVEDEMASSALEIQVASDQERRQAERKYASLLEEYEALGGYDYQHRFDQVVDGVGLPTETLDTPANAASGGERTRAALAKALLSDPDFLILDEPTNYMDFKGLDWLEDFLIKFRGCSIVVSHDRYFLDRVTNHVWEIDRGSLKAYTGNYTKYQQLKSEQVTRQFKEYEHQQEYIAKEQSFIDRYKAGQRSREAKGRETRLARLERIEKPVTRETHVRLNSVKNLRTGLNVLSTDNLTIGYRDDSGAVPLLSMSNLQLSRGTRTGIVGGNGTGKSTLVQTLLGQLEPLAGRASLGHNVEPGYFSQGSTDLPMNSTVMQALLNTKNIPIPAARDYLARFLFRGDEVFKFISALSGGERSRLALASLLLTEPNFLVLDEPTTHLDIPSREALEQALLDYTGTLLFVSHDRRLISLLADQLWIVEDGKVQAFRGNFEEWMQSKDAPEGRVNGGATSTQTRNRKSSPKKSAPKAQTVDYEAIISELEERLQLLGKRLQMASSRQKLDDVARFGAQYNETQAKLDKAWDDWES
jgi:ATP-binding cassette subfamily F protein 3